MSTKLKTEETTINELLPEVTTTDDLEMSKGYQQTTLKLMSSNMVDDRTQFANTQGHTGTAINKDKVTDTTVIPSLRVTENQQTNSVAGPYQSDLPDITVSPQAVTSQQSVSQNQSVCQCPPVRICGARRNVTLNLTMSFEDHSIKKAVTLNNDMTTSDYRTSAIAIGLIEVFITGVFMLLLIATDVPVFIQAIKYCIKNITDCLK